MRFSSVCSALGGSVLAAVHVEVPRKISPEPPLDARIAVGKKEEGRLGEGYFLTVGSARVAEELIALAAPSYGAGQKFYR